MRPRHEGNRHVVTGVARRLLDARATAQDDQVSQRDHAIAACGPRRGTWESRVEATSLTTQIQMIEGGRGETLLPGITLDGGILKGTRLVPRPVSPPAPSLTLALVARRTSPRRRGADLLAEFLVAHRGRSGRASRPVLRRRAPKA